ncbi:leucine-rich repeat domain-containing protein [Limibacter armeniacum]|uniref:leucine-rich repeat domain-containing protein n=1 Tax=Limibacter armeniacum TaxID=466084 RepID=UPI002FE66DD1
MSEGTVTVCDVTFKDPGGDSNYGDNLDITQTLLPETAGKIISVTVPAIDIQDNKDYLYVYDGTDTSAPLIQTITGIDTRYGTIISATNAEGALTFRFTSNASLNLTGWQATASCVYPDAPTDLAIANVMTDRFTLSWEDTSSRPIELDIATDRNFSNIVAEVSLPAGTDSYQVTGLASATNYFARVRNTDTSGVSAYATALQMTTIAGDEDYIFNIPTEEFLALKALYEATGGDSWTSNKGWFEDDISNWEGIYTQPISGTSYETVTSINLNKNNLKGTIPAEIGNIPKLGYLACNNNEITAFPAEIGNLSRLATLDMNNNLITAIPAEIGNLSRLVTLDMNNNLITAFPAEISNIPNLNHLDLSKNQITTIPAEIGNLTSLSRLYLQYNQISTIPAEIGNLTNLSYLYLQYNQITTIPAEIGNLTNLSYLYLYNNQVNTIPAEIGNLTNLSYLHLYSNQISTIPPEVGDLTNLAHLYLHYNQITSIPAEIGNLTNLSRLYLYNNQISTIPPEIGNLTNLVELFLFLNQINSIPTEIGNLTNLKTLHLSNNQVSTIPAEFGNLINMKSLYLDNNQITSVPAEFGNLTSLLYLFLFNNQLSSIPTEFDNLTSLTYLDLKYNQLTFTQLIPLLDNGINQFYYNSQDNLPMTSSFEAETFTLTVTIDTPHVDNHYQWYKSGTAIEGATSHSYTATIADNMNREFYCKVTNPNVANMSLWTDHYLMKGKLMILKVPNIPIDTPSDEKIYLLGDLNDWGEDKPTLILEKQADDTYQVAVPLSYESFEFKFALKNHLAYQEVDLGGDEIANRYIDLSIANDTTTLAPILAWKQTEGKVTNHLSISSIADIVVNGAGTSIEVTTNSDADVTLTITEGAELISLEGTSIVPSYSGAGQVTINAQQVENEIYLGGEASVTFNILKFAPTFSNAPDITKTYGDYAFNLAVTTDAEANISYTSDSVEVISISGSIATVDNAGTATITASVPETDWNLAADTTFVITVAQRTDAISTIFLPETATVDDVLTLPATYSNQGFEVFFEVTAGNAVISDTSQLTVNGIGDITLRLFSEGDQNYTPAETTHTITVAKAADNISETISVTEASVGESITLPTLTTDKGVAVNYELTAGNATLDRNMLTVNAIEDITLRLFSDGNENYYETETSHTITVAKNTDNISETISVTEAIIFEVITLPTLTTDADLPVSYEVTEGDASLDGNTLTVNGVGDIVLRLFSEGSESYMATETTHTIVVLKADDNISETIEITEAKAGETITLPTLTTDAGLPVSYEVTEGNASLDGNTLTVNGVGDITLRLFSEGSESYMATETTHTIVVLKADDNISETIEITEAKAGETITLPTLTTDAGLPVSYEVTEGDASLDGNTLTVNSVGDIVLRLFSEGSESYMATETTHTIVVLKADDNISETIEITEAKAGETITLPTLLTDAGLPVLYEVTEGDASLSGNELTIHSIGNITLRLFSEGNDSYKATEASHTITVETILSIADDLLEKATVIYPNPTSDKATVSVQLQAATTVSITVRNAVGQVMFAKEFGKQSGNFVQTVDFGTYSQGIYLISITTAEGTAVKKVVKK